MIRPKFSPRLQTLKLYLHEIYQFPSLFDKLCHEQTQYKERLSITSQPMAELLIQYHHIKNMVATSIGMLPLRVQGYSHCLFPFSNCDCHIHSHNSLHGQVFGLDNHYTRLKR